jgi:hypothetical protein
MAWGVSIAPGVKAEVGARRTALEPVSTPMDNHSPVLNRCASIALRASAAKSLVLGAKPEGEMFAADVQAIAG